MQKSASTMLSYVYNHCLNFPESNTTYDPPPPLLFGRKYCLLFTNWIIKNHRVNKWLFAIYSLIVQEYIIREF